VRPHSAAPRFARSSLVAAVIALPVGLLMMSQFRSWTAVRSELTGKTTEFQGLSSRNAGLSKVYDILQNKKFQICNKSPYPVLVPWLSVGFVDGQQVKVFDSARCTGWQTVEVAAGENKNILFSSSQEGCNWSGNVVYYAIRYTKETDDASMPYNMAGVYRNFDRDCFNVQ